MELVNADGSAAEMSGNGIRCLTLAVLDWGIAAGPTLIIETTAGLRRVSAKDPGAAGAEVQLVAEMGTVGVGREVTSPLAGTRACLATVGNPHLVIAGDAVGDADISSIGPALERSQPGGVNVELVAVGPASGELRLGVWERGVGATKACGTGSCASAAVAHSWGLVTEKVSVRNPGGVLQVKLSGDDLAAPRALLSGPVRRVARFEVDPTTLPA
jgi:diaminopimelate epimerase